MAEREETVPANEAESLVRQHIQRDNFIQALAVELVEAGPGCAVLRMRVRPQDMNFNGTCHGGAIFGLADSAFGVASNSHGPVAAGIDVHMVYVAAVHEGDILTASARQITDTPRLATYRVDVTNGDGSMVAAFTGTVYVTGRHHTA